MQLLSYLKSCNKNYFFGQLKSGLTFFCTPYERLRVCASTVFILLCMGFTSLLIVRLTFVYIYVISIQSYRLKMKRSGTSEVNVDGWNTCYLSFFIRPFQSVARVSSQLARDIVWFLHTFYHVISLSGLIHPIKNTIVCFYILKTICRGV